MIVETDYQIIQERTLQVIASEIIVIENQVYRTALDGAIEIGNRLHEAKDKIPHGEWVDWCKKNLNYSDRKARDLMKIATEYGGENGLESKWQMSANFSITKALQLLQVPEEERKSFIEEHEISDMTVKELEEEIKKLKSEKQEAIEAKDKAIEFNREEKISLNREIEALKEEIKEHVNRKKEPFEDFSRLEDRLEASIKELEEYKRKNKALESDVENKVKTAIAEEKEKNKKAIDKAVTEAVNETQSQIEKLESDNKKLLEEVELSEKRAMKSSDEGLMMFKLKVDQLQSVFGECTKATEHTPDPDKSMKALVTVVRSLIGE